MATETSRRSTWPTLKDASSSSTDTTAQLPLRERVCARFLLMSETLALKKRANYCVKQQKP